MKFKKIISFVLAAMMITSVTASAKTLEFTIGENTGYESDEKITSFEIETEPYIKNDRTMVPIRVISEKFGAKVEWLKDTRQVVISVPDKTLTLTIGDKEATVNGEKITLDAEPEVINGRTMVPLRFISENLGKDVEYIAPTKQILITDNDVIMSVDGTNIYYDDFVATLLMLGYTPQLQILLPSYVSTAINAIVDIYASSAHLASLGITPSEEYNKQVADAVNSTKETLKGVALVAPFAKLLSADCFLTYHTITQLNSQDSLDDALLLYNSQFVTAKHILILSEEGKKEEARKKAEDILNKIKAGEDFDTLMKEYCEDPGIEQNPNGYTFTYGEMVPEFEKAAFELEIGKVSDIVETSYGYHIIKRESLAPADPSMSDKLLKLLSNKLYNQIIEEAKKNSDYKVFMTEEEIVELLK